MKYRILSQDCLGKELMAVQQIPATWLENVACHEARFLAPTNPLLIGTWRADSSDSSSRERYGDTTLEFRPDGKLIYTENVGT
jgi:hypothetical protein